MATPRRPRQRANPPASRVPPAAQRIIQWLQQSGNYTTQEARPGAGFLINGRYPRQVPPPAQPMNFVVIIPETDPTSIVVMANILFSPEHRQWLSNAGAERRDEIMRDLADRLFFHCAFQIQQDPQSREYLGVQLAEEFYDDRPLSKDALMEAVRTVFTAYLVLSAQLQKVAPPAVLQP